MNRSLWTLGMVLAVPLIVTLGSAVIAAEGGKQAEAPAKEIVLAGKVVDLHTYMTSPSQDKGKSKSSAQLIRNGVPAGLDTDQGLVILGVGRKVSPRTIAKHAGARVELKGVLYEKTGLKYLDVTSVVAGKGKAVKSGDTKSKQPRVRRTPKKSDGPQ